MRFETGRSYDRRNEIHTKYGGQEQSGIVTPKAHPIILLFSGQSGRDYGYADGWTNDGLFRYCGQGQRGDMQFLRGNKAIRDHALIGKELHLFEAAGKGKPVRYVGEFVCGAWKRQQLPDVEGNDRSAIIFELIPVEASENAETPDGTSGLSLEQLRTKAAAAAIVEPGTTSSTRSVVYQRSKAVRDYVLARAEGFCECCGEAAPFIRADGSHYLEPHHTRRLSDGGPDDARWVGAVCPNCHREIHHGAKGEKLNEALKKKLAALESDEPELWTAHISAGNG